MKTSRSKGIVKKTGVSIETITRAVSAVGRQIRIELVSAIFKPINTTKLLIFL